MKPNQVTEMDGSGKEKPASDFGLEKIMEEIRVLSPEQKRRLLDLFLQKAENLKNA